MKISVQLVYNIHAFQELHCCRTHLVINAYIKINIFALKFFQNYSQNLFALGQKALPMTRKVRTHCSTEMIWSCFSTLDFNSQNKSCRAERTFDPVPKERKIKEIKLHLHTEQREQYFSFEIESQKEGSSNPTYLVRGFR